MSYSISSLFSYFHSTLLINVFEFIILLFASSITMHQLMYEQKDFYQYKAYYQQQESIKQSKYASICLQSALNSYTYYSFFGNNQCFIRLIQKTQTLASCPLIKLFISPLKNVYHQSMFTTSIKAALVILAALLSLTFSQTTKAPTVICPTQCLFFTGNGNKFTNDADAARNLSRVIFKSSNHLDILNAFPYYSSSFKSQQLQNLLAFQQMKILAGKVASKFGAGAAQTYYNSISSESACRPYDPSVAQGVGQFATFNMYDDYNPPQTIESLFREEHPDGLYLAWNNVPRKLLTPEQHVENIAFDSTTSLLQFLCLDQLQNNQYYPQLRANINSNSNMDSQETELLSIGNDAVMGFSNMLLNTFYGEELIETYRNCMRQIYSAC